jgi:hypothetical protein
MYLRDFQYVIRQHDRDLYRRAGAIWHPIEFRIRSAIPPRFHFGGVRKIVLELGPEMHPKAKYRELLGVGLYHCEYFDVHAFLAASRPRAIQLLLELTDRSVRDLCTRFSTDAYWIAELLARLEEERQKSLEHNGNEFG